MTVGAIVRPVVRPIVRDVVRYTVNAAPIDPLTLNTGQEGCLFLVTPANLRQDNIDTPAAVGSPVGMFIDTWVANTLGSDIVLNGDFSGGTTNWTAVSSTLSVVSGALRVANSSATNGRATQTLTTVIGRVYKCTATLVTNANGAQLAVGLSSNATTLFLLDIPAGTTGTYTFYFIATSTTSFVQLRTNSTTSGHFTEWDNVTAKHMPGKHLIQQTATARPILRQHAAGWYYLEPDGVDDFISGNQNFTLQLPSFLCCAMRRQSDAVQGIFGMFKSSANFHYIANRTSNCVNALLREQAIGQFTAQSKAFLFPVGRDDAVDSLSIVGTTDITTGRSSPVSAANSFLVGTQLTLAGPAIFSLSGSSASVGINCFAGGVWMNSELTGDQRAGIRAYFNNLTGAD